MSEQQAVSAESAKSYLQIDRLTKKFGDFTALDEVSLEVYEGEFICFLGPSGCGKTTFLRAIAGLDIQNSGTVSQAGKDISALPPSERDFGIVFQSYALFPNLTCERNIGFGLENQKANKADIAKRVAELLEMVGLPDQGKKYPAQLSGGQQQRIALVRALATSPGLLLLDEPLSALDAKVRTYLRHEMKLLQRRLGVTTVMVTHDQEEALTMADRIVVMNQGVIEQIGTPIEIYREPSTLFVADFVGAMNQIEGKASSNNSVKVGDTTFTSREHNLQTDSPVIVAIRPEDIVPHREGTSSQGVFETGDTENIFDAAVEDMEFLGSFWRVSLNNSDFGDAVLIADMSINAVRHMTVEIGKTISVEFQSDQLRVFPPNTNTV
ncbi:MAG: putative 2-aminoethylphosphonate ABC transporter ATP-binding protein [Acidiferrobacteraceae bacterium]|jgi:iron(III) transport system ATP-binding protein|nr:putative 2-aminoethylphosphonate ABC transporter ATP-binding protein [Acidiferrobacteraceae bacterium]MBT3769827.1 putative 2-aminoethylphosphonate ABC transporter ATP-binding protein [Acidiferrobacteraceae bacterium]MBT4396166.1 putative 2-aminoethylphosphonate ABC transporter ATP-binding protein [Acidiferrobacteraceae bacterium]MBT5980202.1 putative 2-aminoethylphosphonate ABC transporter ATP-binding protein [Acidiferrobacteraceae bacterium]MBT7181168.1 putative 2-aminoethylphosphonate ABC